MTKKWNALAVRLQPDLPNWMGNSEQVARKHYLQVTDDHFAAAVAVKADDESKAAHNAAQQPAEMGEIGRNAEMKIPLFCKGLRGIATVCSNRLREWMGIEPTWLLLRGHTGFEAQ